MILRARSPGTSNFCRLAMMRRRTRLRSRRLRRCAVLCCPPTDVTTRYGLVDLRLRCINQPSTLPPFFLYDRISRSRAATMFSTTPNWAGSLYPQRMVSRGFSVFRIGWHYLCVLRIFLYRNSKQVGCIFSYVRCNEWSVVIAGRSGSVKYSLYSLSHYIFVFAKKNILHVGSSKQIRCICPFIYGAF